MSIGMGACLYLREVVGADPLRAVARPNEALALTGQRHLLALALRLIDASPQHLHCLVFVSVLRALILHMHFVLSSSIFVIMRMDHCCELLGCKKHLRRLLTPSSSSSTASVY